MEKEENRPRTPWSCGFYPDFGTSRERWEKKKGRLGDSLPQEKLKVPGDREKRLNGYWGK